MIRLDSSAMKLCGGKPHIVRGEGLPCKMECRRTRSIGNIAKYVNHHRVLRQGAFFWSSSVRVG